MGYISSFSNSCFYYTITSLDCNNHKLRSSIFIFLSKAILFLIVWNFSLIFFIEDLRGFNFYVLNSLFWLLTFFLLIFNQLLLGFWSLLEYGGSCWRCIRNSIVYITSFTLLYGFRIIFIFDYVCSYFFYFKISWALSQLNLVQNFFFLFSFLLLLYFFRITYLFWLLWAFSWNKGSLFFTLLWLLLRSPLIYLFNIFCIFVVIVLRILFFLLIVASILLFSSSFNLWFLGFLINIGKIYLRQNLRIRLTSCW